MSRPRFLADEDFRGTIIGALRRIAPVLEIATVVEKGLSSAPDDEVLDFAWEHSWLVVSHDINTMKARAESRVADGRGIHGLFLAAQRRPVRAIAESLMVIWQASEFEEWRDRIIYLPL